jgi:hypothetical protein
MTIVAFACRIRRWRSDRHASARPCQRSIPDGHFKFPHLWPPKLPQAGQPNYESAAVLSAMREAASLRR